MSETQEPFISVDEALGIIDSISLPSRPAIRMKPADAVGMVLAADLPSLRDVPSRDNSAMDGFLVHKTDLDNGIREFEIKSEIRPENHHPAPPDKGSCVRIMTGGHVPAEGLFVIPVELTRMVRDHRMSVTSVPEKNAVRKQGEGYRKGKTVLSASTVIRPYEAGLAIEAGHAGIDVFKPIEIAIQVTGNEIREDFDTNGPVLENLCRLWPGVRVTRLPVLRDDPEEIQNRLQELADRFDMVLTTGGISAGEHDYIPGAMKKSGARTLIRKEKQKPGKPFTLTRLGDTMFFHLPGNPVSGVFCAEIYARRHVMNTLKLDVPELFARTETELSNHRGGKTLFVTARVFVGKEGVLYASTEGKMRSHLMQLYTGRQAYVRIDPETDIRAGELVSIVPFTTGLF